MIKVRALRDFSNGGIEYFLNGDILEVKPYFDRYIIIVKKGKKIDKVFIPVGFVRELNEEEEAEEKRKEEEAERKAEEEAEEKRKRREERERKKAESEAKKKKKEEAKK